MFIVYIYLIKRHGIGFRDRAKEKNIESETVVTDLICTVVCFLLYWDNIAGYMFARPFQES